eukprot:CAMPEP_0119302024 /NCGR_PEP_ID=MMETSP1333-20130426/3699_1 /TAXON_ID=418940 /ORGANISM="Scyphosphaera apsteinii, Strain RCC1455" /LENGTH=153 /DNA_ID=CAMNT_0007304257 /DNA_START=419 /DNA_END=881 /DNA_ORIENTATION=+
MSENARGREYIWLQVNSHCILAAGCTCCLPDYAKAEVGGEANCKRRSQSAANIASPERISVEPRLDHHSHAWPHMLDIDRTSTAKKVLEDLETAVSQLYHDPNPTTPPTLTRAYPARTAKAPTNDALCKIRDGVALKAAVREANEARCNKSVQ